MPGQAKLSGERCDPSLLHAAAGMAKTQEMTIVRGIASQCCEHPLPEQWIEIVSVGMRGQRAGCMAMQVVCCGVHC